MHMKCFAPLRYPVWISANDNSQIVCLVWASCTACHFSQAVPVLRVVVPAMRPVFLLPSLVCLQITQDLGYDAHNGDAKPQPRWHDSSPDSCGLQKQMRSQDNGCCSSTPKDRTQNRDF